jgi:hypothetical protein
MVVVVEVIAAKVTVVVVVVVTVPPLPCLSTPLPPSLLSLWRILLPSTFLSHFMVSLTKEGWREGGKVPVVVVVVVEGEEKRKKGGLM